MSLKPGARPVAEGAIPVRWSELAGKEIINLHDGARLGRVADADLVFDPDTGEVDSLLVYGRNRLSGFFGFHSPVTVPWDVVRRVGPEVLIIEMAPTERQRRRHRAEG